MLFRFRQRRAISRLITYFKTLCRAFKLKYLVTNLLVTWSLINLNYLFQVFEIVKRKL